MCREILAMGLLLVSRQLFARSNTLPVLDTATNRIIAETRSPSNDDEGEDNQDLQNGRPGRCVPIDVLRSDYFLDVTSTLPHYPGPARMEIHVVSPVYNHRHCEHRRPKPVILVHGRTEDGVTAFDLQYRDYSLQEALARAGLYTVAFSRLGFGLSSRFGLDDPCNASIADQKALLIPNPLSEICANPDPFHFTNIQVFLDELDEVVNHVRRTLDVHKVSLFSWSRGGPVAGRYAAEHPERIKSSVMYASGYNLPNHDPPDPLPQPGPALELLTRAAIEASWLDQTDVLACPGEIDRGILDPWWESIMAHDELGRTWETGGLKRVPSQDIWGWDAELASVMTVPTLVIGGLRDTTVLPALETRLYDDLGSPKKAIIRIECGSHFAIWEAADSWAGPHTIVQRAAVEWFLHETFNGSSNGEFNVDPNGVITGPF